MDNYIYYRIMDIVIKNKTISRSELVDATSLHSYVPNPIDHLTSLGFMKEIIMDNRKVKYYQITKKGLDLHKKMFTFFNTNKKLFQKLHTKLKLGVRLDDTNEEIVLLSTTQS